MMILNLNRNRLSKLSYSGHKKISRINRKTAIIAFSAEEVYAIAELIEEKRWSCNCNGIIKSKNKNAQLNYIIRRC